MHVVLLWVLRGVFACTVCLLQAFPVSAEESRPGFGILDTQKIMTESLAARMVLADRERYQGAYQGETAGQEQKLRTEDEALLKLRSTLNPEELSHRQQAFQQQVTEFQKQVQSKRRRLERSFAKAMADIQSVLIRLAHGVARERGMGAVFYRSQVFLFDPRFDITDEVLIRLDKELPGLSMVDPSELSDPDADDVGAVEERR